MMTKHGSPQVPDDGKRLTPWPSDVLVYKAQPGCFVPQPAVSSEACLVDGCTGSMLVWPDGKKNCQKCGAVKENLP